MTLLPVMNPLRHQLPAWTPLGPGAIVRAGIRQLRGRGEALDELAARLADRHGGVRVVLTGSGTEALSLALGVAARARESARDPARGDGAPVALPAYSCYDLVSAAVHAGRPVHFYDLDPRTLAPDAASLEAALEAGARVVVVAPLFGVPIKMVHIRRQVHHFGAVLIEDAAQGWGASWEGAPLGSHGDLGVLSFGRGKGWTSGAGGGALVVRDAALVAALDTLWPENEGSRRAGGAQQGSPRGSPWVAALALWALSRPGLYRVPRSIPALGLGETRFHPPTEPSALGAASAALLLEAEAAARNEAGRRAQHGEAYRRSLLELGLDQALVHPPEGGEAGWLRFPVLLVDRGSPEALPLDPRARRLGAERSYPAVLPSLPQIAPLLAGRGGPWPGAEALVRGLVTLPTHSRTRSGEREALVRWVSSLASGSAVRVGRDG